MFIIDDIISVFRTVIEAIVKFLEKLAEFCMDHPKTAAAIFLTALALYGGYRLNNYVDGLKDKIVTLQTENQILTNDVQSLTNSLQECKSVNDNNQNIINSLTSSNLSLVNINKTLNVKGEKAKGELSDLQKRIDAMSKEDDGPIAKTLREAVSGVDKNRKDREESWTK